MSSRAYVFADEKPWLAALMDEYARAIDHLATIAATVPPESYQAATELSDAESPHIQGILDHVVGAANRYVDYLEQLLNGADVTARTHTFDTTTPSVAMTALRDAFARMVDLIGRTCGRPDEELAKLTVLTRWGQRYDLEQMLEHAIVHILRHRRQIERWLALAKSA